MSRRDVQGYAMDMIAMTETQTRTGGKPKPPPPPPVLLPAKPSSRPPRR